MMSEPSVGNFSQVSPLFNLESSPKWCCMTCSLFSLSGYSTVENAIADQTETHTDMMMLQIYIIFLLKVPKHDQLEPLEWDFDRKFANWVGIKIVYLYEKILEDKDLFMCQPCRVYQESQPFFQFRISFKQWGVKYAKDCAIESAYKWQIMTQLDWTPDLCWRVDKHFIHEHFLAV